MAAAEAKLSFDLAVDSVLDSLELGMSDNYRVDNYRPNISNYDVIPINPIKLLIAPIIQYIFWFTMVC